MEARTLPVFNIERFSVNDGPGVRTCIFLQGCPLVCPWCANPESQQIGPKLLFAKEKCVGCGNCLRICPAGAIAFSEGRAALQRERCSSCMACTEVCTGGALIRSGEEMPVCEIKHTILRDQGFYRRTGGGVTFTGGEALLHIEALTALLEDLKREGISIAFETCGALPEDHFVKALPWTDWFLFDVKSLNEERFQEVTGGDLKTVLQNFRMLAQSDLARVIPRIPLIPGFNAEKKEMEKVYAFIAAQGVRRAEILPYHTYGVSKYRELGRNYSYPEKNSLRREAAEPFVALGKEYGIDVKIL